MPPHALPSNAARALFIARSISSAVEFGIRAITSPVAGLRTSSICAGTGLDLAAVDKLPWISTSMARMFGGDIHSFSSFDDDGVALQRRQHAFFGLRDMRLDEAGGRAPVAPLHRLDQRDVFGDEFRRIVAFQIGDADAHQAIGLSDQVAQRGRHAAVAGCMGERRVEGAVIGDEVFVVAGEAAEFIQRLQGVVARALDRLHHAGRLQRKAESQQVARIGQRDRIDPVALARLHRDEMLAFEPQQRLAHRLAAHGIALGQILFAHIIAWREVTCQDIRPEAFVDIIAQKHRNSFEDVPLDMQS